jgi:hypothetical protein
MIYAFNCDYCNSYVELSARAFHPPKAPLCSECGMQTYRSYGCHIDTAGCKDHDEIPEGQRVQYGGERNISKGQAAGIEAAHQRHNDQTRRDLADGGNRGALRKTHQIPAALFHGKIKQTGDRNYWDDPKNRNRHKSTRVDS